MSINSINTNVNALNAQSQLRILDNSLATTMKRLSTGVKLHSGADGPADLALVNNMRAHIGGIRQAVNNAEDALSMLSFADTTLNGTMDILQRMSELSVRASNVAVLTSADVQNINQEIQNLKTELTRRSSSVTFNSKVLFSGGFSGGQMIQVGADNASPYQISLVINMLTLSGLGMMTGAFGGANFFEAGSLNISTIYDTGNTYTQSIWGAANAAIDVLQSAINIVSDLQESIGVQEMKLQYIIEDLSNEELNITAAKSRIEDADMAAEISEFAKLQVLTQSATAMLAQANLEPTRVTSLLGI